MLVTKGVAAKSSCHEEAQRMVEKLVVKDLHDKTVPCENVSPYMQAEATTGAKHCIAVSSTCSTTGAKNNISECRCCPREFVQLVSRS